MKHFYTEEEKNIIIADYKKGIPLKGIVNKYGVKISTFYSWFDRDKRIKRRKEIEVTKTSKEYYILKRKYEKLLKETEVLKDFIKYLPINQRDVCEVALKLKDKHPLKRMSRLMNIPKATIYHYIHDRVTDRLIDRQDEILKKEIRRLFELSDGRLGYKKMHHALNKTMVCSYTRTARLMKEMNLQSRRRKTPILQKVAKKRPNNFPEFNLLKQNFNQESPNRFWVGDVTEVNIKNNKYYIAVILDLFSRMVVGCRISTKNDTSLVANAFKDAYEYRDRPANLVFHSDQGTNYSSHKFCDLLSFLCVGQSFSRRGTPYDNSCMESFYSNMKQDDLNSRVFENLSQLQKVVDNYVFYYNNYRPHNTLNHLTPYEFEESYYNKKTSINYNTCYSNI